jgi:hypothetical protein
MANRADSLEMPKDATSTGNTRQLMRWGAIISIIPDIGLPFYNAFLHGPRFASSIVGRGAAYSEAHMVGATASLLLVFGLVAMYLAHAKRIGKAGLVGFMLALAGQILWVGLLLVDGILNPLLAHFDPITQTHLHSAEFSQTASGHGYLTAIFGPTLFFFDLISLVYLVGFIMFGVSVIRAKLLPWPIGALLAIGSVPVAFSLMLPQWLETLGYAAIGWGIAWAAVVILKHDGKRPIPSND